MSDDEKRIMYYVSNGGVSEFAVERETVKSYFRERKGGRNAFRWAYVPARVAKGDRAVHPTLREALEFLAWQMGNDIEAATRRMEERKADLAQVLEAIAQCQS